MLRERFDAKWEPVTETGCWLWNAAQDGHGYGQLRINKRTHRATRVSYELHVGNIPAGMHLLHKCDVPACVNPAHLFLGSNVENIQDSMRKGRRKGITRNRPRGLRYNFTKRPGPKPKLSDETKSRLRADVLAGMSQRAAARKYGVSSGLACRICA